MRQRSTYTHPLFRGMAALVITLGATGCVDINKPDWARFSEISSHGWDPEDILVFEPMTADSIIPEGARYDFTVIIRNSMRREVRRIPIAVTVEDASGNIRADTLVIGAPGGPPLQSKTAYGVRETSFTLLDDAPLTEGFSITLSPLSEASETKGLLNIGVEMHRIR